MGASEGGVCRQEEEADAGAVVPWTGPREARQ